MLSINSGVRVHHLADKMEAKQQEAVLRDLMNHSENERLLLVVNCSGLLHLNYRPVMVLLSCLESR